MVEVAVIAFEGISLFHLSVPIAIFEDATLNDNKLFKITVCAESAGHLRSANGLAFDSQSDISAIETTDVIIVPSWDPSTLPSQKLQLQLNEASKNNKMIVD
ncbi:MAG: hypothetical protein MK214_07355 [Thalassotalea sp.]|nr:hypothetical protein [Thalassotalea sp.]